MELIGKGRTIVLAVIAGLVLWAGFGYAKSKQQEDFPDYNRLEYPKPLPPVDQQVPQPKPGSISMRVGEKNRGREAVPLEEMSVPLMHRTDKVSESEPPMDGFFDEFGPTATSIPIASTSTVSASTTTTTIQ